MKALALHGARDARLIDLAEAELGPGEVRVQLAVVGLCGSDAHFYSHGQIGAFRLDGPLVIGHEGSGTVVEVASDVGGLSVGQRVAIEPGVYCGSCHQCRLGAYNLCSNLRFLGMPPNHGLLSERAVLPARQCHPVPDTVDDEAAALLEPLSVAIWAAERGQARLDDSVLITGAGPIGTLIARVVHAAGASRVTLVDVDQQRLRAAAALPWAEAVPASRLAELEPEFSLFFECSGASTALNDGLLRLGPHGRAVLVGVPSTPEIAISSTITRYRELTITTVHRYAHTWPHAVDLVGRGAVAVSDLVTNRYTLDTALAALDACVAHQVTGKAVVRIAGGR